MVLQGSNFDQPLPEIIINGNVSYVSGGAASPTNAGVTSVLGQIYTGATGGNITNTLTYYTGGSNITINAATVTTPNLDPAIGALNDYGQVASGDVPGESLTEYINIRKLGAFTYQYINVPGSIAKGESVVASIAALAPPVNITFAIPTGTNGYPCIIHYTFGPKPPTSKVDHISCFRYNPGGVDPKSGQPNDDSGTVANGNGTFGAFPNNPSVPKRGWLNLTKDKGSDGTFIYAIAFSSDGNGNIEPNDQSPLLIAKLHINLHGTTY